MSTLQLIPPHPRYTAAPSRAKTLAEKLVNFDHYDRDCYFKDILGRTKRLASNLVDGATRDTNFSPQSTKNFATSFFTTVQEITTEIKQLYAERTTEFQEQQVRFFTQKFTEAVVQRISSNCYQIGQTLGVQTDRHQTTGWIPKNFKRYEFQQALLAEIPDTRPEVLETSLTKGITAGGQTRIKAELIAEQVHLWQKKIRKNFDSICDILQDLNTFEWTAVVDAYQERFGQSITNSLYNSLKLPRFGLLQGSKGCAIIEAENRRLLAILRRDLPQADAHELYACLLRGNITETHFWIFRTKHKESDQQVLRAFHAYYGEKLESATAQKLSGWEHAYCQALTNTNDALADAIYIRNAIKNNQNLANITKLLESSSPEHVADIVREFNKHETPKMAGKQYHLAEYIQKFYPLPTFGKTHFEKDQVLALLSGQREKAAAYKVALGLQRNNFDLICEPFLDAPPERRNKIVNELEVILGRKLKDVIRYKRLREVDRILIESAIEHGQYDPAARIRHALELRKPDASAIKFVLKGKTQLEINETIDSYKRKFPLPLATYLEDRVLRIGRYSLDLINERDRNLHPWAVRVVKFLKVFRLDHVLPKHSCSNTDFMSDLFGRLSGHDAFEIRQALRGQAKTCAEVGELVTERLAHLESGYLAKIESWSDRVYHYFAKQNGWTKKIAWLIWRPEKLFRDDHLELQKALLNAKIEQASPAHKVYLEQRLRTLTALFEISGDSYHRRKVFLGDFISNLAASIPVLSVTISTLIFKLHFISSMPLAFTGSLIARALIKAWLKGDSHSHGEFKHDLRLAIIDGTTFFMAPIFRSVAMRELLQKVGPALVKMGFQQMVNFSKNLEQKETGSNTLRIFRSGDYRDTPVFKSFADSNVF